MSGSLLLHVQVIKLCNKTYINMQIVLSREQRNTISPKIRSFAKLIALPGNDRKGEKTSLGMSIHKYINKPKTSRNLCGWGATSSGQNRGPALSSSKIKMCSPCSPPGTLWGPRHSHSPPLGTPPCSAPLHSIAFLSLLRSTVAPPSWSPMLHDAQLLISYSACALSPLGGS